MTKCLVYLTYNSEKSVLGNLPRLIMFASEPIDIIAIDNASEDRTVDSLRQLGIEPIINDENLGYTKGVNIGISEALKKGYDWIFLINPDVGVPYGWDKKMLSFLWDKTGIIGVKLSYNGKINHSGGDILKYSVPVQAQTTVYTGKCNFICTAAYSSSRLAHKISHKNDNRPDLVSWVTFACVALNANMIREIGLLDERYFLYNSDSEYCLRAWSKDWQVLYNPIEFHHSVGKSSVRSEKWLLEIASNDANEFLKNEESLIKESGSKWAHLQVGSLDTTSHP